MDGFEQLLQLSLAAETCWGQSHTFVERFGRPRDFSRDSLVAAGQARTQWSQAERLAAEIQTSVARWDEASAALYYVSQAVGVSLPSIMGGGGDLLHTAHEAARDFAEAVLERFWNADGETDAQRCRDLAEQLNGFVVPDLWSRLQAESHAAGTIAPLEELLTPTEARNKFCYEQWQRGQTLKEINVALKKHSEWERYEDDRGVRSAVKAWAEPRELPVRTGQPGKPKKAN